MSVMHKLDSWVRFQSVQDGERERQAILRQQPAPNPEHLTRPTKVRRIGRGFTVAGRGVEMGETVTVDAFTAEGLCKMGRAELVEG